jgi:hypothetical protein
MRKITAIAVAPGFLTSVSLPAFATPEVNGIVKSDELSAAKKKKKKDTMEKKSSLGATDPLRCQEEKEKGHDGEEIRDSLSHRGLTAISDLEFCMNGRMQSPAVLLGTPALMRSASADLLRTRRRLPVRYR